MGTPGVGAGGAAPRHEPQRPDPEQGRPDGASLPPGPITLPRLTVLGEIGAEQVVLGVLGQGLDVDGSRVGDRAAKALHLLVPLRRVQGEMEICGGRDASGQAPFPSTQAGVRPPRRVPGVPASRWKLPSLRSSRLPALLLSYLT